MEVPQNDPGISLLSTYTKDTIFYHRDTCTFMFIAALYTVARRWNTLMPVNRTVKVNVAYTHHIILLSYEGKWIELGIIIK